MSDVTGSEAAGLRRRADDPAREWSRRGLLSVLRGLAIVVLSQVASYALFVLTVVSIALIPVLGVGLFLTPPAIFVVREVTGLHRRLVAEWFGVPIPAPYRPRPAAAGAGPLGWVRTCRWMLSDPATWRDLVWLPFNAPVGLVLGLVPAALVVYGLEGVAAAPFIIPFAGDGYGYGLSWFSLSDSVLWAVLAVPQGLLLVAAGMAVGPAVLRRYGLVTRWLLAPTRKAELALRVRRLTETRSDAVDTQAAELRRIERDLHDGAQARLVALSMSIGLAEDLLKKDPAAAQELLAEMRDVSGQALSELRDLVRGIHPPVLAERGLDGAVRALALTLPMPVDVDVRMDGRPQAPVESAGYFAVAESLANVAKHASASRAWVQIDHEDGRLVMIVGDDGAGGADPDQGSGLRGIERRLAVFDGTIAVTSPSGGPTIVTMELPCELSSPRTSPSSGTG